MRTREIYLTSSTKVDRFYVKLWLPDEEPRIIVQIAHGMVEHIGRYEEFAQFLCAHGIGVAGNDHLGHGRSVANSSQYGYFAKHGGKKAVLADMHCLTNYLKKHFPDSRLILIGHSMGSFFSRRYITKYSKDISAAVFMGTGYYSVAQAAAGKLLAGFFRVVKGEFYRSRVLYFLTIGAFSKKFVYEECKSWQTRDQEQADKYAKDPMCNFIFTASAYYDLFSLLLDLACKKEFQNIRKRLPILLISGDSDPVGGFGRGVRKVYRDFRKLGMKDLRIKLYPEARHELINEINRKEVYQYILEWINQKVS